MLNKIEEARPQATHSNGHTGAVNSKTAQGAEPGGNRRLLLARLSPGCAGRGFHAGQNLGGTQVFAEVRVAERSFRSCSCFCCAISLSSASDIILNI